MQKIAKDLKKLKLKFKTLPQEFFDQHEYDHCLSKLESSSTNLLESCFFANTVLTKPGGEDLWRRRTDTGETEEGDAENDTEEEDDKENFEGSR